MLDHSLLLTVSVWGRGREKSKRKGLVPWFDIPGVADPHQQCFPILVILEIVCIGNWENYSNFLQLIKLYLSPFYLKQLSREKDLHLTGDNVSLFLPTSGTKALVEPGPNY